MAKQPTDEDRSPLGDGAPEPEFRRVQVIANPAAGRVQPVLAVLNDAFQGSGIEWDVAVTKGAGDGAQLAEAALAAGVDAIAVWGGDGTVTAVAGALVGQSVPLAIVPGGTANVMARELGIPANAADACALIRGAEAAIREVDVGELAHGGYFLLRVGLGFEAEMVAGADRESKHRLGPLAYTLSGLRTLGNPPLARYGLTLDGREITTEGIGCIIANSGSLGLAGLRLTPAIEVGDGLLDVIVIRRSDLPALLSLAGGVVLGYEDPAALQHWQVREVVAAIDPPQKMTWDGESYPETPAVQARVLPHGLRVVVPRVTLEPST